MIHVEAGRKKIPFLGCFKVILPALGKISKQRCSLLPEECLGLQKNICWAFQEDEIIYGSIFFFFSMMKKKLKVKHLKTVGFTHVHIISASPKAWGTLVGVFLWLRSIKAIWGIPTKSSYFLHITESPCCPHELISSMDKESCQSIILHPHGDLEA